MSPSLFLSERAMADTADLFLTLTQPHSKMSYNTIVARKLKGPFASLPCNLRCAFALGFPSTDTLRRQQGEGETKHRHISSCSNDDGQDNDSSEASSKSQDSSLTSFQI